MIEIFFKTMSVILCAIHHFQKITWYIKFPAVKSLLQESSSEIYAEPVLYSSHIHTLLFYYVPDSHLNKCIKKLLSVTFSDQKFVTIFLSF